MTRRGTASSINSTPSKEREPVQYSYCFNLLMVSKSALLQPVVPYRLTDPHFNVER